MFNIKCKFAYVGFIQVEADSADEAKAMIPKHFAHDLGGYNFNTNRPGIKTDLEINDDSGFPQMDFPVIAELDDMEDVTETHELCLQYGWVKKQEELCSSP